MNGIEALDFAIRTIDQHCDLATNPSAVEASQILQDLRLRDAEIEQMKRHHDLFCRCDSVRYGSKAAPRKARRDAEEALASHVTYVTSIHLGNDPDQHHGRIHGDERIGYRADCSCGWAQ